MPKFNAKTETVPVPSSFIDTLMPSANGAYVKVYLTALSLGMTGGEMSTAEMAGKLNLLESDVVNALSYWDKQGALSYSNNSVTFFGTEAQAPRTEARPKKDMEAIRAAMTENPELGDLCALSQEILGKTLRSKDIETLYWFYDGLGLSPEVITMLLEYCVSRDKRNMSYIEKVAISWHENGIVTIEAADKFINDEKEKNGYFYSLRKLFGIENRNLSKKEEDFLKSWRDECSMDETMVALAYEYCIMQTSKLSFPYMNSIIRRWHELGIHTVADAERDHEDFKTKNKQNNLEVYNNDDFNYAELEKLMQDKN